VFIFFIFQHLYFALNRLIILFAKQIIRSLVPLDHGTQIAHVRFYLLMAEPYLCQPNICRLNYDGGCVQFIYENLVSSIQNVDMAETLNNPHPHLMRLYDEQFDF